MQRYNPKEIEPKWQKIWEETGIYQADDHSDKPKKYILEYFPYPSGAAMHVGHVRNYAIGDAISRFARMRGYNVMHPMGWDAFGLPAENYAIKTGISPQQAIIENTGKFKRQLTQMGIGYDWSREFASSDPEYYRWTQWFFLFLFKKGLAYRKESLQWWCPVDKTVLANEQVEAGRCWRCGSEVEKKSLKQWFFKITAYADRLADDLDDVNWTDSIKNMQRNWIGRSKGAEVVFAVEGNDEKISVFTTRPDTLYGATFLVLAPEHPLVSKITIEQHRQQVENYQQKARNKSDIERQETNREKTGIFTGAYAINPVNGQRLPVWVADYVLFGYGTGAIMAVPAHDERDHEFANKFALPIIEVVEPVTGKPQEDPEFRRSIVAIVRNPRTHTFLSIDWGENGGNLFIGGGREQDEDVTETALREIAEETGYTNLRLISKTGPIHHHYFAHSKNVARQIEANALLFDLVDESMQATALEDNEKDKFTVTWLTEQEVTARVQDELHATAYQLLVGGACYHGEGIMVNSGRYDGMPTSEVREKIVAELAQAGTGKERINYKMRDWLISRQRYWGAPIPIIHCEACKKRIETEAHAINFYSKSIWQSIVDGKKTIESRADNPEEPDRQFADVQAGQYIKLVNKSSGEVRHAKVLEATRFASLAELFNDKPTLIAIFGGTPPLTLEQVEASYASLADGYVEKIRANGLICWRFELIEPGEVAIPEDQLPVTLPDMDSFEPSDDGRSPLARDPDFVHTTCPQCGGEAERETDTMDGFACSSWYFLRFADPHNAARPFDDDKAKYWLPVDDYIGGAEHAVMHLLYARMWTKVMFDEGMIAFNEPFKTLRNHGMILAPDGQKMSKSKGNTIQPDVLIEQGYGSDAIRIMEFFIGPWNQSANWSVEGMGGSFRFLQRVWTLVQEFNQTAEQATGQAQDGTKAVEEKLHKLIHHTIRKVSSDLEDLSFNTAIAAMMELLNGLYKIKAEDHFANRQAWQFVIETLLQMLAPFAPHITEELWYQCAHETSIHLSTWPTHDEKYLVSEMMTIVVQINGKVRAQLQVAAGTAEDQILALAQTNEKIVASLGVAKVQKTIYIPGKLVSLVAK